MCSLNGMCFLHRMCSLTSLTLLTCPGTKLAARIDAAGAAHAGRSRSFTVKGVGNPKPSLARTGSFSIGRSQPTTSEGLLVSDPPAKGSASLIQRLVSKNKKRFEEDGFSLDLARILKSRPCMVAFHSNCTRALKFENLCHKQGVQNAATLSVWISINHQCPQGGSYLTDMFFFFNKAYITPQLIAMGFPSLGTEGLYRHSHSQKSAIYSAFMY